MKLNQLFFVAALSTLTFAASAQENTQREIIYKWTQGGKTFYSEWPPHGVNNYVRLNNQGMVLNDIPDLESFLVIRPDRPASAQNDSAESSAKNATPAEKIREGTITRRKRCENARQNLKTISEKQTIYEEDQAGNLIPLSSEEVAARREQAQAEVTNFCSEEN